MNRLKIRSEIAQEVVSRKPSFVERWAIIIFFVLFLILLMLTWFIKYPDTINTNATLSTADMPKEIININSGKIERFFFINNDTVTAGSTIAWIKTNGNHQQVLKLKSDLDSADKILKKTSTEEMFKLFDTHLSNLGELQPSYEQFILSLYTFREYSNKGFFFKKYSILLRDLNNLKLIERRIAEQKKIAVEEEKIKLTAFNRMEELFKKKVVSKLDIENQRVIYLNARSISQQYDVSSYQNQNSQQDKYKEVNELKNDIEKRDQFLIERINNLRILVQDWCEKYIITAQSTGVVALLKPIQENQYLESNTILGYINPESNYIFFFAYLTQNNFGKIHIGQKVQLRIDAYPYTENGIVYGSISYISPIATEKGFLINIRLTKGLRTSSGMYIPFKNGLTASAIVITKEYRLIDKFYYSIIRRD